MCESDGVHEYGGDDGRGCWRQRECHSGGAGVCEHGSVCVYGSCPSAALRVSKSRGTPAACARAAAGASGDVREYGRMRASAVPTCGGDDTAGSKAAAGAIAAVSRKLDWEQSGREGMKKVETTPWQPRN
jgi:hypothetical protein